VYFGVSTLLDASSSDGQKSDEEQKEVIFGIYLLSIAAQWVGYMNSLSF